MGEILIGGTVLGVLFWIEERSRSSWFYPFLVIVPTLLHELAHFFVALLLGGKPSFPSLVPKREGCVWVLGQVRFQATPFNAFPTALAPLGLLPLAIVWAGDLPLGLREAVLWASLKAFLPSSQDLRVAFSYPLASFVWIALLIGGAKFTGKILPVFVN